MNTISVCQFKTYYIFIIFQFHIWYDSLSEMFFKRPIWDALLIYFYKTFSIQWTVSLQICCVFRNCWYEFNPKTNVLWVHYLAEKLLTKKLKRKNKKFTDLCDGILNFASTFDMVLDEFFSKWVEYRLQQKKLALFWNDSKWLGPPFYHIHISNNIMQVLYEESSFH